MWQQLLFFSGQLFISPLVKVLLWLDLEERCGGCAVSWQTTSRSVCISFTCTWKNKYEHWIFEATRLMISAEFCFFDSLHLLLSVTLVILIRGVKKTEKNRRHGFIHSISLRIFRFGFSQDLLWLFCNWKRLPPVWYLCWDVQEVEIEDVFVKFVLTLLWVHQCMRGTRLLALIYRRGDTGWDGFDSNAACELSSCVLCKSVTLPAVRLLLGRHKSSLSPGKCFFFFRQKKKGKRSHLITSLAWQL